MIVSFRDDWLRDFFVEDVPSKKIPSDLESRLFRRIQMIDDATSDQDLRVRPAIISKSCVATCKGFIRSVGISDGGLFSSGKAAGVKRQASIWTITAISEVKHVTDEAQAGERRRNPDGRVHGADEPDARRVGGSHGRAAQTRQRVV
jgi:toxin HigB-1